jgi:hypothetical protein
VYWVHSTGCGRTGQANSSQFFRFYEPQEKFYRSDQSKGFSFGHQLWVLVWAHVATITFLRGIEFSAAAFMVSVILFLDPVCDPTSRWHRVDHRQST